jgi:hypothetical protein
MDRRGFISICAAGAAVVAELQKYCRQQVQC